MLPEVTASSEVRPTVPLVIYMEEAEGRLALREMG